VCVCVLQDFLFDMAHLWSSMTVSHLDLYTQQLPSAEWTLCFTRRYSSTVWKTFYVEWQVEVICGIFKIGAEENFQGHFGYPSEYSDWAVGTQFWFLAGAERVLVCTAFRLARVSRVPHLVCTSVMYMGIKQLWFEDGHSPPCSIEVKIVPTLLQYCCIYISIRQFYFLWNVGLHYSHT
jgi:hypothetical protein